MVKAEKSSSFLNSETGVVAVTLNESDTTYYEPASNFNYIVVLDLSASMDFQMITIQPSQHV